MKANELRVGNLVSIDNEKSHPTMKDKTCKVIGFSLRTDKIFPLSDSVISVEYLNRYLNEETYSQFNEFIKPIPLTKECLIVFGFTHHLAPQDRINVYNLHDIMNLEWWNDHASFDFGAEKIECKLYFVHQLQNLYFSLTGNELQITDK